MSNEKIMCPRCTQGYIVEAIVKKNGRNIFLCEECEAVWFCNSSIEYATFNYFDYYMGRLGLEAKWDELEIINE